MKHRSDLIAGLAIVLIGVTCLSGCGRSAQAPAPPTPAATAPSTTPPAPTAPAGPGTVATVSFTDIGGTSAAQAIKDMAAFGIFESTAGEFKPRDSITRAEFVRWLVKADNVYYKEAAERQIRQAESDDATFVDVPATHPDFKYIQGMANAGYVIGVDKTHFAPGRPITREEMIAIKNGVDRHGRNVAQGTEGNPSNLRYSDKLKVSPRHAGAVGSAGEGGWGAQDIARVWGSIKTFNPQKAVIRAEAAMCLSVFGWSNDTVSAAKAHGRKP